MYQNQLEEKVVKMTKKLLLIAMTVIATLSLVAIQPTYAYYESYPTEYSDGNKFYQIIVPAENLFVDSTAINTQFPTYSEFNANFAHFTGEYLWSFDISNTEISEDILALVSDFSPTESINMSVTWNFGVVDGDPLTDTWTFLDPSGNHVYTKHHGSSTTVNFNGVSSSFPTLQVPYTSGIDVLYEGTGSPYFSYVTLDIFLNLDPLEVVDVGTNYNLLPVSEEKFIDISTSGLIDSNTNTHYFIFENNEILYKFYVSLPDGLVLEDLREWILGYTTSLTGEKILYIAPDDENGSHMPFSELGTLDDPIVLYRDSIALNLTTSEYHKINNLTIKGVVSKESNSNAYLYAVLPLEMQDLYSIELSYKYRLLYLFSEDDYETVTHVYDHNATSEINPPNWIFWLSSPWVYAGIDAMNVYNIDTIQSINVLPDSINERYLSDEIGGTQEDLAVANLYKIHVGQFKNIFSTGYDIQDVVIMDIIYGYNGIIYEVPYEVLRDAQNVDQEEETDADTTKFNWPSWIEEFASKTADAFTFNSELFSKASTLIKIVFISTSVGLVAILGITLANKLTRKNKRPKY